MGDLQRRPEFDHVCARDVDDGHCEDDIAGDPGENYQRPHGSVVAVHRACLVECGCCIYWPVSTKQSQLGSIVFVNVRVRDRDSDDAGCGLVDGAEWYSAAGHAPGDVMDIAKGVHTHEINGRWQE